MGAWTHQGSSRIRPLPVEISPSPSTSSSLSSSVSSSSGLYSVWDIELGSSLGGEWIFSGQWAQSNPSTHLPNRHFGVGLIWTGQQGSLKEVQFGMNGSVLHFTHLPQQTEWLVESTAFIPVYKGISIQTSYTQIIDRSRDLFGHLLLGRLNFEYVYLLSAL